ncbi:hypothetical protein OJJOAM_003949 [Cupriavidus sp. H18C1]
MMPPNSSSVFRRPCALTDSCRSVPGSDGEAPITPAATCTFCSRIARTTSLAASWRSAIFSGSSHTRIA